MLIIACGGTIDAIYGGGKAPWQTGKPAAAAILRRAKAKVKILPLLAKDSLFMTDADRRKVAAAVAAASAARIVITHGTDTVTQTAAALIAAKIKKTVVLVGAFVPAAVRDSDADFNLGFALAAAQTLPAGVYIAMNGRIFDGGRVKKNRAAGRFVQAAIRRR